jgi:serine/threonine protein phosphatase PrpC
MGPHVFGSVIWTFQDLLCRGEPACLFIFFVNHSLNALNPPPVSCALLRVPRSLGDAVAHTAGVISDPEFTEKELDPSSDRVIVVATDGLWEFVNNDETINLLSPTPGPAEAVDCLVKEANARWMQEEQVIDDTTVIVAHLFDYKATNE